MNQALTKRIALDRTTWHTLRCGLGWHVPARYELREFTLTQKQGRKEVSFTVLMNVQEAICCGKALSVERVA